MNEEAIIPLCIFALVIILAATAIGSCIAENKFKKDAVLHNKAEYVSDEQGDVQWKWKDE